MDDERKTLIVSGVYLGDIALALAGLAAEIPQWIQGLDLEKFRGEAEAQGIGQAVEKLVAGNDSPADLKALAPQLAEVTVERAIAAGKFLSATRCLEILNRKGEYVDKYIALARKHLADRKVKEAAQALAVASSLEINEGTPLFQYTGPALHEACTSNREKCVTAIPVDAAVLKALEYLLEGPKTCEAVGGMTPGERAELLPFVGLERDPDAGEFYKNYKQAHADLEEIEKGELAVLIADVKRIADEIAGFAGALTGASGGDIAEKDAFEGALRTAGSLKKEFSEITRLFDHLELRRVRRRLEQLLESREDLEAARGAVKKGSALAAAIERLIDLIDDLNKKGLLEGIDGTEERILATQVTMLGRAVHSQEHWQYLRELAFKYPVSPLVCCVRRINAKWMVVPAWSSPLTAILIQS
jgi:hypothetical protein